MTLTLEEMIEILEGIARESNNTAARIAAIKTLMEIAPPEPDRSLRCTPTTALAAVPMTDATAEDSGR